MIITVVSSDGVAFAVNVHPTDVNIKWHRLFAKLRPASQLAELPDFVRVDEANRGVPDTTNVIPFRRYAVRGAS